MINRIQDWLFSLKFFLLTGCTQRWLSRTWSALIEKDIHPADTFRLVDNDIPGSAIEVSGFGSQVHVVIYCSNKDPADPEVSRRMYEFTVNWIKGAGFYVHEKRTKLNAPWEMGDWTEVYRQRSRILRSGHWMKTMRLIAENMDQIEDMSQENMMGTEIHEGKRNEERPEAKVHPEAIAANARNES